MHDPRSALRRPGRSLAAAIWILPLCGSCTSHPLEAPVPDPLGQVTQHRSVNASRDVDILFMVDNSSSMEQEQKNLARNFPAFIRELEKIEGGLPNLHLAVVTSDMGAGGANVGTCTGLGDGGNFQTTRVLPAPMDPTSTKTSMGCGLAGDARFIVTTDKGARNNLMPGADVAGAFSCMAERGIGFCGFEHQLQSTRLALYPQPGINPTNAGFLRPDAFLAIIVITDEDDCSAPGDAGAFFTGDIAGQSASYRCATEGHVCNGQAPPAAGEFSAPLASCRSNEKGRLFPVQQVVDHIKQLKPGHPERIVVSAIAGWPAPGQESAATYRAGRNTATTPEWDLLPICKSGNGQAAPAVRIHEFVSAFGDNSSMHSICQDDFSPALAAIGELLRKVLTPTCLDAPPVDSSPEPGLQPDCVATEKRRSGTGTVDKSLPACAPGGPRPCWSLIPDAIRCRASGFYFEVDRGGAMALPNTDEVVSCAVCTSPGQASCALP